MQKYDYFTTCYKILLVMLWMFIITKTHISSQTYLVTLEISLYDDTAVYRALLSLPHEDKFEDSEKTRPALCIKIWKNLR